jgi:DNA processing protein
MSGHTLGRDAAEVWRCRPGDEGYPASLADLEGDLPRLFGAGDHGALARLDHATTVTIVGARRASAYGLRIAEQLAFDVTAAGLTVVSGMALGIDAAAHRGALRAGGPTIAVLANGPDVAYPSSHRHLHGQIRSNGAVISEYPPGSLARKHHFRDRNRLMAALGKMAVIVEGALPSGSLITSRHALDLGRSVGAVPGHVDARNAEGTNQLLRDGAVVVRGARDVLDELLGVGSERRLLEPPPLDPLLAEVLDLVEGGAATVDRIAVDCGIEAGEAAIALARLELLGYVGAGPLGGFERRGGGQRLN